MSERPIRLYGIPLSHPVLGVRGMLDRKSLPYRYVQLMAGTHPLALWAGGFRGATVPAMRLPDGTRVQGSLAIARALERLAPVPPLWPEDPGAHAAAEAAEAWGEAVLQDVPRRLIRWGLTHDPALRRWFAKEATPLPAPSLVAVTLYPVARIFGAQAGATDAAVRRDVAELPALMDEVDRLLAAGVIGGPALGAADFQIAPSIRALLALGDAGAFVRGRQAEAFALRLYPDYPPVPLRLPAV